MLVHEAFRSSFYGCYSSGTFVIECFYIDFDGGRYGPVNKTFQIRKFDGFRDINSLPIYPFVCDPEEPRHRETFVQRGKVFTELTSSRAAPHRKYKGLTLDEDQEQVCISSFAYTMGSERECSQLQGQPWEHFKVNSHKIVQVDSEVIIDFQLFLIRNKTEKPVIGLENLVEDDLREVHDDKYMFEACGTSGCCSNDVIYRDYEVDEKERADFKNSKKALFKSTDNPKHLTADHEILLPPKVYGFVLRTRKWASFNIDLLTLPDYASG